MYLNEVDTHLTTWLEMDPRNIDPLGGLIGTMFQNKIRDPISEEKTSNLLIQSLVNKSTQSYRIESVQIVLLKLLTLTKTRMIYMNIDIRRYGLLTTGLSVSNTNSFNESLFGHFKRIRITFSVKCYRVETYKSSTFLLLFWCLGPIISQKSIQA